MPILGKRKYINDRIEKLINKLDMLGYDTTEVKKRYYDYEDEEEEQQNYYEQGPAYGGGLPYRDKINDVLQMIENLITQGPNYYENQQEYYDYNTPGINQRRASELSTRSDQTQPQSNPSIYYSRQPQEFKNNLMYQLNNPQTTQPISQPQNNQQQSKPSTSFNLF